MHIPVVLSPISLALSVHRAVPRSHEVEAVVVKEVEADMATRIEGTATAPATPAVPEAETDTGLVVGTLHATGATMAEETSIDLRITLRIPGPVVLVIKWSIGQEITCRREKEGNTHENHASESSYASGSKKWLHQDKNCDRPTQGINRCPVNMEASSDRGEGSNHAPPPSPAHRSALEYLHATSLPEATEEFGWKMTGQNRKQPVRGDATHLIEIFT